MKSITAGILCISLLSYAALAAALEIRTVRHDRDILYTEKNENVTLRFALTDAATVTLNVYDGRELMIRSIATDKELAAGEHSLVWNGKDQADRHVPSGAYHYTLQAKTADGETVEHDLTDLTGGEDLQIKDIKWDPDAHILHYVLTDHGLVNIRMGLKNDGPLLRTLIDWVPRAGGVQQERWDGMDQSNALNLSRHPQLLISAQAFSLSDNTILVDPEMPQVALIEDLPWGEIRREVKKHPKKRMYAHAQQPLEARGDFSIALNLPEGLAYNKAGVPVVRGTVPVRLVIDEKDRARALARRFEPVFFLDGVFVFENETGFLPMTWNWDTSNSSPGDHYLTANLRGYEGNFGIATVKVHVASGEESE